MTSSIFEKQHYIDQMKYICKCIQTGIKYQIKEIIIDNFAGGGGASTGIEIATGYSVFSAINHDPQAIKMHQANHPGTKHYCESVWDVDPLQVCEGHPVGLAWFSPDCKHFSKAKGGKPVEKKIRGLAWIVLKWAALVRPRVIMLENVEEFQTWGPCIPIRDEVTDRIIVNIAGKQQQKKNEPRTRIAEPGEIIPVDQQIFTPDPKRKGQTYKKWCRQLEAIGYQIETRELVAADYGTPTMRKRFFMIARCDGQPTVWPEPTHGARDSEAVKKKQKQPYVGAYTQIDFSKPCPSIFDSATDIKEKYGIRAQRPLADKTMQRIARGLQKFVIENTEPFLIQVNHSGAAWHYTRSMPEPLPVITAKHGFGIVEPKLAPCIMFNNEGDVGASIISPLPTITTGNRNFVVAPTLIQYHSETTGTEIRGQALGEPIMTLDGTNRYGLVSTFISKFRGTNIGEKIDHPLPTITAGGLHEAVCAAYIMQQQGKSTGTNMHDPINTITVGGMGHMHEVRAFLLKYYGQGTGQKVTEPLDTITGNDRFGLVTIYGVDYVIVDIGLRMLEPKELYGCQGVPDDYIIDHDCDGKPITRSEQVKKCGNMVCPPIPAALVKANLSELCTGQRMPNMHIEAEPVGQLRFA